MKEGLIAFAQAALKFYVGAVLFAWIFVLPAIGFLWLVSRLK